VSRNYIKLSGSTELTFTKRKNFTIGVMGSDDYGPSSITGFYCGVEAPVDGYTIYSINEMESLTINVAYNDQQCIFLLGSLGSTGTTIVDVMEWANTQQNVWVVKYGEELTPEDLIELPTTTPTSTSIPPTSTPTSTPIPPTSTPTSTPTIVDHFLLFEDGSIITDENNNSIEYQH
jgi:hypothetical protein